MSRAHPELSFVFPMWNERANIDAVLRSALRIGPKLAGSFEVVVVDDGSRDGSAAVVEAHARRDTRVRLVAHAENRGYGAALRSGLREARGDLVFFTDADLQFDLSEIESLLRHAESFDIVAGYRSPRRDPWHRRLLALVWGLTIRTLFGLAVRDIDCAFKVFRREVLACIPIASIGAFVNTEILVRARSQGFRIRQVPVSHHPRRNGTQSGAHPRVIARAVRELLALHRELRELPVRTREA